MLRLRTEECLEGCRLRAVMRGVASPSYIPMGGIGPCSGLGESFCYLRDRNLRTGPSIVHRSPEKEATRAKIQLYSSSHNNAQKDKSELDLTQPGPVEDEKPNVQMMATTGVKMKMEPEESPVLALARFSGVAFW